MLVNTACQFVYWNVESMIADNSTNNYDKHTESSISEITALEVSSGAFHFLTAPILTP